MLFCGICLKHYAYHNMSRRTQLTTKYIFQVLAQLSENFIFIYLGLSLFTQVELLYRPVLILITVIGICIARYAAIFPLSGAINWIIRYRAKRQGRDTADQLPFAHKAMLFWAGLRGAVGVALAAGFTGRNQPVLKATVLVVVVLTVIIFGGTTARMLEILNIRTGVIEEIDSDDEFDIEIVANGTYGKRSGTGFGHIPKASEDRIPLDANYGDDRAKHGTYSSGNARINPPDRPQSALSRKNSARSPRETDFATQGLLSRDSSSDDEDADLDLPPSARKHNSQFLAARRAEPPRTTSAPPAAAATSEGREHASSSGGIRQFLSGSTEDPATWFRHLDEGFIKPKLLLDPQDGSSSHHGPGAV